MCSSIIPTPDCRPYRLCWRRIVQSKSERHAAMATTFMGTQGIDRSRIAVEGMGETEPITDNDTETGRQENRRIEVVIFASED